MIISFVVCFETILLGIVCKKSFGIPEKTANILLAVCALFPIVLSVIFWLINNVIGKKLTEMAKNVAEMQSFMLSHREDAIESAKKELAVLFRVRFFSDLWAVFLALAALGTAFFCGCSPLAVDLNVPILFYSALLFCVALSQIRLAPKEPDAEPDETELTKEDYPRLHALAEKAQADVGCTGKIRIYWINSADSSAAISQSGKTTCVYLDVVILNLLTEDELYAILLHEFAHLDTRNAKNQSVSRYFLHINGRPLMPGISVYAEGFAFLLFDNLFSFHHMLFSYASSVENESYADGMMRKTPLPAATALLKIKYYELWNTEYSVDETYEPIYRKESPTETYFSDTLARFHASFPSRRDFWNGLVEKEILSRSASHPTIASRIRALGFETLPTVTEFPMGEWKTLGEQALHAADCLIHDSFGKDGPSYREQRAEQYEKPLARVTEWEDAGKPLIAETYADIMADLFRLGRITDALALADRAIAELPVSASHSAYFERGRIRLLRYDPAGLDDIYAAMEQNNNYIDGGLDLIGRFCCQTGMQKELDTYREKALVIGQKYQDESMQITDISKKDDLSEEHLPDGVLEEILAYIGSVSEGSVERVYLFRKTVSESFFSSTFVLEYVTGTEREKQEEIYHRVFRYLDTSSDWQYSLYEFSDIPAGILDKHPEYLVWSK